MAKGHNQRGHLVDSRILHNAPCPKRSGVRQEFISEIEVGNKKPSLETAYRLAQALGVKVDDLIQPDGQADPADRNKS